MSQQELRSIDDLDAELKDAVVNAVTQTHSKHIQDVHIQKSEGHDFITVTYDSEETAFSMYFIHRIEKKLGWTFYLFTVHHSSTKKSYSNVTLFFHPKEDIL